MGPRCHPVDFVLSFAVNDTAPARLTVYDDTDRPGSTSRTYRMTLCIALLRGINVGMAKRLAMADLRALCAELGYTDVRTLLNSGNIVFRAPRADVRTIAQALAESVLERCGFPVPVVVLDAEALDAIIAENTLRRPDDDPARFLVAFVDDPAALESAKPLLEQGWEPETLALGDRTAYLRCPGGVADSELLKAFTRATGDAATTRNWSTVLKLQAAAAALADPS